MFWPDLDTPVENFHSLCRREATFSHSVDGPTSPKPPCGIFELRINVHLKPECCFAVFWLAGFVAHWHSARAGSAGNTVLFETTVELRERLKRLDFQTPKRRKLNLIERTASAAQS
jgi:hypothetical protein